MTNRIMLTSKKIQEIPPNQSVTIEDDYSLRITRGDESFIVGRDQWLCARISGQIIVNKIQ